MAPSRGPRESCWGVETRRQEHEGRAATPCATHPPHSLSTRNPTQAAYYYGPQSHSQPVPERRVPFAPQKSELSHPVTFESLASRVCNGDDSLLNSEQQRNSYEVLSTYLNKGGVDGEDDDGYGGDGLLLAAVCIFMWTTVIAKELDAIYHDVLAMYHQRTVQTTSTHTHAIEPKVEELAVTMRA